MACTGSKKIASSTSPPGLVPHGKLWASVYEQKAAEYKALCLQAYNIARFRLDEALKQPTQRPRAIITDIDETFLDNSPFAVHMALQGKDYEADSWNKWTAKGEADTLTGALSFFKYAADHNTEVFYVSNRKQSERAGTLQNLRRYQFPFADDQHLLLRLDVSSKEPRRQQITATYDVILLLGDNLTDFSAVFDNVKTNGDRAAAVQQQTAEFGKKFIVLPNPGYGNWEDAIYGYSALTMAQKDSAVKSNLKNY